MYPTRTRLLLLAPVRLALGAAGLAGALVAGADARPALLAVALGAAGSAPLLLSDRRALLLGQPRLEPLPAAAERAPWPAAVAAGLWPSSVGVAFLAIVALFADLVLTALLSGILVGMAVASLLSAARLAAQERRERIRVYGELAGRRLFVVGGP